MKTYILGKDEPPLTENEAIKKHMGLVHKVLIKKGIYPESRNYDTAYSGAVECLLRCVRGYDVSLGWKFSTYTVRSLFKAIYHALSKEYTYEKRFKTGAMWGHGWALADDLDWIKNAQSEDEIPLDVMIDREEIDDLSGFIQKALHADDNNEASSAIHILARESLTESKIGPAVGFSKAYMYLRKRKTEADVYKMKRQKQQVYYRAEWANAPERMGAIVYTPPFRDVLDGYGEVRWFATRKQAEEAVACYDRSNVYDGNIHDGRSVSTDERYAQSKSAETLARDV